MRRATRTATLFTIFALASAMAACSKKDEESGVGVVKAQEGAADPDTGMAAAGGAAAAGGMAAAGMAAAGGAAAAATVGACTVKSSKSCSETKLNNPDDSATYGKMCADIEKGTWAEGPCPMENVIGECNSASAGRTVYYKGAKDARHTCEQMVMGGVFTAMAK